MKGRKLKNKRNLKTYFYIFTSVCVVGLFTCKIAYQAIEDHLLASNTITTKAEIIDEKNYWGNSPVSHQFSYSYYYTVNGKIYKGDSHDTKFKLGDTINIAYVPALPGISKVVE